MAFWGMRGDKQHIQACVDKVVEVKEKVVQQQVVVSKYKNTSKQRDRRIRAQVGILTW